jgi:predicted ATP-dependent protease
MATALYSLITGRKAKQKLAMTGELSLVGKVLPVGGIKEKLLAARRAGITTVILPKLNEKDVQEVPEYALKGMTLHFASRIEEVLDLALVETKTERQLRSPTVLRSGTATGKTVKAKTKAAPRSSSVSSKKKTVKKRSSEKRAH